MALSCERDVFDSEATETGGVDCFAATALEAAAAQPRGECQALTRLPHAWTKKQEIRTSRCRWIGTRIRLRLSKGSVDCVCECSDGNGGCSCDKCLLLSIHATPERKIQPMIAAKPSVQREYRPRHRNGAKKPGTSAYSAAENGLTVQTTLKPSFCVRPPCPVGAFTTSKACKAKTWPEWKPCSRPHRRHHQSRS